MSEHYATISWYRNGQEFTNNKYSRGHTWVFDGGLEVPASPSPHVVPPPQSIEQNVDPEEAFVASLSSCHMLFFLSIVAAKGIVVDEYEDEAVGVMGRNDEGKVAMTRVTLQPQVAFSGDRIPDMKEQEALHHRAHDLCFIANSVKTIVETNLRPPQS